MPTLDVLHGFMPYPHVVSPHASSGPLAGLTFAVKDLFDIQGYPTSGGQPLILAQSGIKTTTAPTIQRLLDSGATLVGKTITDELAFSIVGSNAHFGAPINAASPDRFTGGSSTGSAAVVAAHLVDFSIGTDTGGSVRAPASNCGLFGIRPTHGRVSLEGCMDLSPSFDTCGWFSRDIETFMRVAEVLLGADNSPLASSLRLIVPQDVWSQHATEIVAAVSPAKEAICQQFATCDTTPVALESFDTMLMHFRAIQGFEAWKTHGRFIRECQPVLGPGVAERFELSSRVSSDEFNAAVQFRATFQKKIDSLLADDGVLLIPTMSQLAPLRTTPLNELDAYRAQTFRFLCIAGHGALPQITLPLSTKDGGHLGLSLIGPRGSDRSLSRLAQKIVSTLHA
jgi:amidase